MRKIALSSIALVVSSLIVGCSNNEYIKEKDIIGAEYINESQLNTTFNIKKSLSKIEEFPIYFLDKNIRKVKYLPLDINLSIEDKINIISKTISNICFNNLPMDIFVDGKKVNVNLRESDENRNTWKDDFLDDKNLEETTLLIVKNLLQEDYAGEWINTVHITYEGKDIK